MKLYALNMRRNMYAEVNAARFRKRHHSARDSVNQMADNFKTEHFFCCAEIQRCRKFYLDIFVSKVNYLFKTFFKAIRFFSTRGNEIKTCYLQHVETTESRRVELDYCRYVSYCSFFFSQNIVYFSSCFCLSSLRISNLIYLVL